MKTIELPKVLQRRKNKLDRFVFSSRTRLARNLNALPFPSILDSSQKKIIEDGLTKWLKTLEEEIEIVDLNLSPQKEIMEFLENRVITPEFIQNGRVFAYDINGNWVLQINEEDHIRLFSLFFGYEIKKAYQKLSELLNLLEKQLDFSFDEKWGYLTSSILNMGTGLRFSVLVNLFGLMANKQIEPLIQSAGQMGYSVSNIGGEKGESGLFFIHNIYSLGENEKEMLHGFEKFLTLLYEKEMEERHKYFASQEERELAYEEIFELKEKQEIHYSNLLYYVSLIDAMEGIFVKIPDSENFRSLVFQTSNSFLEFKQLVEKPQFNQVRMELLKNQISALKYK